MTLDLTAENQSLIDQAIRSGAFHDPNEVISAALESLAEDMDDVATARKREGEQRFSLEEVEAGLRERGKLK